jgi:hypothetical protein
MFHLRGLVTRTDVGTVASFGKGADGTLSVQSHRAVAAMGSLINMGNSAPTLCIRTRL